MELINKLNYDTCHIIEKIKDSTITKLIIIDQRHLFLSDSGNLIHLSGTYIEFIKNYSRQKHLTLHVRYCLNNLNFEIKEHFDTHHFFNHSVRSKQFKKQNIDLNILYKMIDKVRDSSFLNFNPINHLEFPKSVDKETFKKLCFKFLKN